MGGLNKAALTDFSQDNQRAGEESIRERAVEGRGQGERVRTEKREGKESGGPTREEKENLVDVPDIFYFFCSGRGKGESEAPGGWGGEIGFLLKIPGGGGAFRGWEGPRLVVVCGEFGGGGVNFFFRAEMSTKRGKKREEGKERGKTERGRTKDDAAAAGWSCCR